MKPYFVTELGELYCLDALKGMKHLSDVDLIVTDPPYAVTNNSCDYLGGDYKVFIETCLNEFYRVLKHGGQIYIFFSQKWMFDFWEIIKRSKFTFKRLLIWHHPNLAKPTRKMYLYTYDPIFYLVKGEKPKYFDANFVEKHNFDVFIFPKPQTWGDRKRLHPFQKPLELIKILIMNSSRKGDVVLDPFAGSGTTLIASELLGRRWIGFEIREDYCKLIVKRFSSILCKRGWW